MRCYWLLMVVGLSVAGCSGGKEGGDQESSQGPGPVTPQESFTFKDGTTRKISEMAADPDCRALLPDLTASRSLTPNRGIQVTVRDEASGEERKLYCWNPS